MDGEEFSFRCRHRQVNTIGALRGAHEYGEFRLHDEFEDHKSTDDTREC